MAEREAALQKGLEDRQRLAEEMERLGQEAEDQLQAENSKLEVGASEKAHNATGKFSVLFAHMIAGSQVRYFRCTINT
jgi:hypothetical protein